MEPVRHLEITLDEDFSGNIVKLIFANIRPEWDWQCVQEKIFTDGITNKIRGYYHETDMEWQNMVLIRRYGEATEKIICRKSEIRNLKLMHENKCGPELYASISNGLVYGFVCGTICDEKMVWNPDVYKLIAQEMAKIHNLDISNKPEFDQSVPAFFTKTESFLANMPSSFTNPTNQDRFNKLGYSLPQLKVEYTEFKKIVATRAKSPLCFCHNDILLANIVLSKDKDQVTFIDHEYGDYNYAYFDIGDHFCEMVGTDGELDYTNYPDRAFQIEWLKHYYKARMNLQGGDNSESLSFPSDQYLADAYNEVNLMALAAHFMWGVWAFVQAENSSIDFDFLQFGTSRMGEYFARKEEFLAYLQPK